MYILQVFLKNSFLIVVFLFSFIFSKNTYAHENVMLEYRLFFKFDNFNVTDIGENWVFDKITSAELMEKYKIDKNMKLNKKQSIDLGNKIMEDLYEVRYFTYIFVNDIDIGTIKATNFKAQIKNESISIAFNNKLTSPVNVSKSKLSVEVKDPSSSIIAVLALKQPVTLIAIADDMCKISIKQTNKPMENALFQEDMLDENMIFPQKLVSVKCKS